MRVALLLLAGVAWGQEFEVASIHPTPPDVRRSATAIAENGQFIGVGATVRLLIESAYRLNPFQLTGGPGWIEAEKFDIQATAPAGTTYDQALLMLRKLLVERFGLRLKRETKEQAIYVLQVREPEKLKPAATPGPSIMRTTAGNEGNRNMRTEFLSTTMARFAEILSRETGRMVIDETGLAGEFDFTLQTEREVDEQNIFRSPLGPSVGQVGLRLESRKGMVETYAVESVERPTEN